MKRLTFVFLILFLLVFSTLCIAAAPPVLIDYQASISGPGGTPLEGDTDMIFRIFDALENGNEIASDAHLGGGSGAVPAISGLVNVKIGSGLFSDGSGPGSYANLADVVRAYSEIFLQIEINGEALTPRVQVTSAAYALNSATLDGESLSDLQEDTNTRIATHAGDAAAHHTPYTDAEAVLAMGQLQDSNPLNHNRLANADIVNVVAASNLVPQAACDGADKVLRWTGSAWICEVLSAGLSNGNAKGFEITDDWGAGWDGIQRVTSTWIDADTKCKSLGGRLPSVTELFRNNATNGSGSLGDTTATSTLWTLIPDRNVDARVSVRLSDGNISQAAESTTMAYRCVWAQSETTIFAGDACYGGCQSIALGSHMDSKDRPALNWVAASHECNFYKASLPDSRTMQEAIQSGLPNASNNWLLVGEGKYWHDSNYGVTLARFNSSYQVNWQYVNPEFGSVATAANAYNFRCVGRSDAVIGELPNNPPCFGGCSVAMDRAFPIYADNADRAATGHALAAADCAASGGTLPHLQELGDLAHQGWSPFPEFLWTSDPVYFYNGGYGFDIYKQNSLAMIRWNPATGSASLATPDGNVQYRCVWRTSLEPIPTVCSATEIQLWDGSAYSCEAAVDGDAGGNANAIEVVDGWGNAWDYLQRAAVDYDAAASTCESLGGSLPLPGELYRVRYESSPLDISIGSSSDIDYLWTSAPSTVSTRRTTLRLSDGMADASEMAGLRPYRCVWRSTRGDAFGARDCHGETADPCFQAGPRRWDRYDRPAVTQTAAAYECAALGGRLPNLHDFQRLVADGAPNGSDDYSWISETMFWYSNGYGYATGRWSGAGTGDWTFSSAAGYASLSLATSLRPFRCVFSNELK